MALVKATLKAAILDALNIGADSEQDLENPVDAADLRDQQADALVDAIDAYIKSATIIVPMGIPVATTGTAAAQTGATTAPSGAATIG
jgi:hypothetical protein